jgi:hypothetical protein
LVDLGPEYSRPYSQAVTPSLHDPARTHGAGYYAGVAMGLRAEIGDETVDLGDGGLTTWTGQLLGDAKERCLVSCVATERLAAAVSAR